jgi:hypothetical protein
MAMIVQPYKVDDLEVQANPTADVHADRTLRFAVNGEEWEIDLTEANAGSFLDMLRPYQAAGRRVRRTRTARPASDREEKIRIREWAKAQGEDLHDRGRIPGATVARYRIAHGLPA